MLKKKLHTMNAIVIARTHRSLNVYDTKIVDIDGTLCLSMNNPPIIDDINILHI